MFLALEDILSDSKYSLDLPSKKAEKWHFSGLHSYLDRDYRLKSDVPGVDFRPKNDGYYFYLSDGKYIEGNLPESVKVQEFKKALDVKNNPFSHLASSQSLSPLELVFSEDVDIHVYVNYAHQCFLTSAFNIIIKEGVSVNMHLLFTGGKDGFITHSSALELYPRSTLNITQIQNFDQGAIFISQNSFLLHEYANCKSFGFLFSGEHIQQFIEAELAFESEIQASALLLADEKQKEIFSCDITHKADRSKSRVYSKQVLKDSAISVFDATTTIEKGTKQTEAYQASHALVLGEKAQIHAKPHLEIYSDDLTASHGSTVGELDQDAIGYLMSRGIGEDKAKDILVEAFIKEVLELVDEDDKEDILKLLGDENADERL